MPKSASSPTLVSWTSFRYSVALVEQDQIPKGSFLIIESLDRFSREDALDRWDQLDAWGIEAELYEVAAGLRRRMR